MTTTVLTGIGLLVPGPADSPPIRDTSLVLEDGLIAAIGEEPAGADRVIDAAGLTVLPGLVDGHVHPTFGEWTPAQNSIGWITNYVHGGTTTMVSAGELHVPGLPFEELTPSLVSALAVTAKETTGRLRPSGMKASVGTVLLVPGMSQARFDELAEAGVDQLKFIFYDWGRLGDGEAQQYVTWAHERGMTVKMHSGGVSRSGSSRVAGHEVVSAVRPDVIAHISGGPIPMPDDEIRALVADLPEAAYEVCSSMNYRATLVAVDALRAAGRLDRLTLGTDTPGGTGVIPRGMMRNVCFLASICGLDPVLAVAAATDNTARAHGLKAGRIAAGYPADLVICGPIQGSMATDALESFALGDLPGISMILIDGEIVVGPRSQQTPPPKTLATMR
ncbi:MAG: amidohydrolase family protein [Streptosporangiales bacterium]|nr:amidohydrolase family protein [Streptosporangiales bacterium]